MTRGRAALFAIATIALGIASRKIHLGFFLWDKSLGDALYAVMVYFLVAFVRPTLAPRSLGIGAFAISFAIELFQLTGIPLLLPRIFRIALGTTFAWHDVICYAVGAIVVAGSHAMILKRQSKL